MTLFFQKRFFAIIFVCGLFFTISAPAHAEGQYDYDIAASIGSITFVPSEIHAEESIRIYGTIVNVGRKDISGYVAFYQGVILLDKPQPFSLKANGVPEEIWIDWTPTEGTYNVMMTLVQTTPQDQNPGNNVTMTRMLTVTKRPPPVVVVPPPPPPAPAASQPSQAQKPVPTPSTPVSEKQNPVPVKPSESIVKQQPTSPLSVKEKIETPKVAINHFPLPEVGKKPPVVSKNIPLSASSTIGTVPLPVEISEELKKNVAILTAPKEQQVEIPEATVNQGSEIPQEEKSSFRLLLIGGIIAIGLFLIGLLLLKRSRIV